MKILIGITAGIALYKSLTVIRELKKLNHNIKVIMTENAIKLINPIVFSTICENKAYYKDFDNENPLLHIQLSDWADVFAIIPATANTISKLANGIGDNFLTTTFLAFDKRKIIFPSMNVKMYNNPIIQENINKLVKLNIEVIEPEYGQLACGYKGKGRLPDEEIIVGIINRDPNLYLKGKKYIVTAGGTIEKIDPVRFISNFSSGRMGIEIAKVLFKFGAQVLIVYGNIYSDLPKYIPSIKVNSTLEMLETLDKNLQDYDGLFMAAAPVDFRIEKISERKLKKDEISNLNLVLNPDILKNLKNKYPNKFFVGFALETENYINNALKKINEKSLDYIVLNKISENFNPMGNELNSITLIDKNGNIANMELSPKEKVAEWMIRKTLLNE